MIANPTQLAEALEKEMTEFADLVTSLNEAVFTLAPAGKWSAGQHWEHLLRSIHPVYMAIGLPCFVLRLLFGRPNRQGRNYEQVVNRYKAHLAAGGAASGRFVPPAVPYHRKGKQLRKWVRLQRQLQRRVLKLSNTKLDGYLLPHPLLGKLTLREMLFFTIYHTQHHLHIVQQLTGKAI